MCGSLGLRANGRLWCLGIAALAHNYVLGRSKLQTSTRNAKDSLLYLPGQGAGPIDTERLRTRHRGQLSCSFRKEISDFVGHRISGIQPQFEILVLSMGLHLFCHNSFCALTSLGTNVSPDVAISGAHGFVKMATSIDNGLRINKSLDPLRAHQRLQPHESIGLRTRHSLLA